MQAQPRSPRIEKELSIDEFARIQADWRESWLVRRCTIFLRQRESLFLAPQKCSLLKFLSRVVVLSLVLFLTLSVWRGISGPSYVKLPQRYLDLAEQVRVTMRSGRGNVNNEKVFIAANIINEDLIRGTWGNNLVALVNLLGEDNVFISIYENDSGNGTSEALMQLQQRLKCNTSIVAGDHVPLSSFPTVQLPDGERRVKRLIYLAEMRNRLLRPLDPSYSHSSSNGFRLATDTTFDRILFLNDVYYSPLEAIQLLFMTNAGSGKAQYRAACAIDFVQLFKLYDTFVVRDTDGYQLPLQFFPWFTYRGSGTSRKDVLSMTDAVRVRSCWGGMAAFDARVFQPRAEASSTSTSTRSSSSSHHSANNQNLTLKFRSDGEPFWEAAECCLIFADMETQLGRPSTQQDTGVFINPYIRTAYSRTTWSWLPFFKRYERIFQLYHSTVDLLKPPEWNPRRTHSPGDLVDDVVWIPERRNATTHSNPHYGHRHTESSSHGHFEVLHRPASPGGFCGERRMFVMKNDIEAANQGGSGKNWETVRVPWY